MKARKLVTALGVVGLVAALPLANRALAHCDGLDGPVVQAARRALETGNVNLVLIWVQEAEEPEIRSAFQQAVSVRKLGPDARQLADKYFFETLVRVHRAGEGAPYTGLKPAGRDLGPAIPAADRAVATGSVAPVEDMLVEAVRHGLREEYAKLAAKRRYDPNDVAAGREFVKSYVEFIHYVERLHESASHAVAGHYGEPDSH